VPNDLQACLNGGGFRLTHVGSDPMAFFAENEDDLDLWTAAMAEAVSFG